MKGTKVLKGKKSGNPKIISAKEDGRKFPSEYGHFTRDGREYVITRPDTPRPWINVLCNGDYGLVVSQTGSGFSWQGNSNLARISRWEQDLVRDEWGKYVYVRDKEDGQYWSLTWKPLKPEFDFYEARYGLGYAVFKSLYRGIRAEKTIFVDKEKPLEAWRIRLKNETDRRRDLSLFTYFEWCLGNAADTHREFHKTFIETRIDRERNALYGIKRPALVPRFISSGLFETPLKAFHASNVKPVAFEGDKEAFFGKYGDLFKPRALAEGRLSDSEGKWLDASASLQVDVALEAGEEKTVLFFLGVAQSGNDPETVLARYDSEEGFERELQKVRAQWDQIVSDAWIETPDEGMNFLTNIWLKYQAICGRIWARCAYYQSSGGIGFRDQLQDSHVFLPLNPDLTRKQILLHAKHQFPDGTVFHWWHPDTPIGAHTEMVDDLLWMPYLTLSYLDETADESIFDEEEDFLPEKGGKPTRGTLYEHCIRAIDKVLSRFSKRGLPLMGEGDWNDGLSHVGIHWRGESVWLGHFLYGILNRFAPYAKKQGDPKRAKEYLRRAQALKAAINRYAWDGEWYFRAVRDDGELLGSRSSKEGKIFLNAQTWAVICGTATPERAKIAMKSAEKYLYREYGPLLLTPAFSVTDQNIGYISRYAPGLRENGGVYTHAATWGIWAQCLMGNGEKAYETYNRLSPILKGMNPEHYYVEPYVTPGNADGPDSPYFGRGGWTWYTGSAAWLFRVTWEGILGIQAKHEGLRLNPVIPKHWDSFKARRIFRGATYEIEVRNPNHVCKGVKTVWVDGKKVQNALIRPHGDGKTHKIEVVLG